MADYEYVTRKEVNLDETVDIRRLAGKRVLSKGGTIVGNISEVRVNSQTLELDGLIIGRQFEKPIYIGKSYFSTLSNQSVILNIEPSILLKGLKVVTSDGKVLGKVIKVNRVNNTNEINSLLVRRWWNKYLIPSDEIKQLGNSVLIKRKYDATKIYIWKRPE